ncbi:hypothetical protein NDU88_000889 [Pleurodeles waltl]|uniref:Uncharacterized protein n=1 Tax=Pleurodeles waltl TaxID=8319 RepID=A0AAV7LBI3_PLEWA|nr:hypothetical protein NDU88_000889 [Pleurodeles waltl]
MRSWARRADLLRRPAAELRRDREGRACWFGPRRGAAARSGAACTAEAGPLGQGAFVTRTSHGCCSPGRPGGAPGTTWSARQAGGLRGPSEGQASGSATERAVPVPRGKRSRARRIRRRGEIRDLKQLMQERREAIHSAAAISASPLASESDTELSQPPSDRLVTPDRLSELGLVWGPPVTPATADELF